MKSGGMKGACGLDIVRFRAGHVAAIAVQPAQLADWPDCASRDARAALFEAEEHCWSFVDPDGGPAGKVVACFGMVRSHAEHLTAWAILSEMGAVRLGYATRWCRQYIAGLDERRIDVTVRRSFANGHQWSRLLGLGFEGWQRRFFADGEDMAVYARIDGVPADQLGSSGQLGPADQIFAGRSA